MRILQAILLCICMPILGATLGAVGLGLLGAFVVFRPDPATDGTGAWGSAIGAMLFFLLGGIIGAISGLVAAIYQLQNESNRLWSRTTWVGIACGSALCALFQFMARNSETDGLWKSIFVETWWGALAAFVMFGATGGFLGCMLIFTRDRSKKDPSRFDHF